MNIRDRQRILVIEDNPADVETIRRATDRAGSEVSINVISNGTEAEQKIEAVPVGEEDGVPDLILLDLNLPGMDGRDLLKRFDRSDRWSNVPVVVLTTSNNNNDIKHAYRHGANAYVVKPGPYDEYVATIRSVCDFWLGEEITR